MVLGEGIFAANQALELTNYTPDVSICTQGKEPTMTADFKARLDEVGIPVFTDKIVSLQGKPALESAEFADGSKREFEGLFVAMGEASSSDFAYTLGLERSGVFIKANCDQQTNIPGVLAAGDCVATFPADQRGRGRRRRRRTGGHSPCQSMCQKRINWAARPSPGKGDAAGLCTLSTKKVKKGLVHRIFKLT